MSENVNVNDLNDEVEVEVEDAQVITVPIDDTLSNSGEAADAKAVGDALALKADRSELQTSISVNGQTADNQGMILLLAEHIPVSDATDAQTVKQVLTALGARTGEDIRIDSSASAETIAEAINGATARTADAIRMSSASDAQTVAQAMAALAKAVAENASGITALDAKTGAQIRVNATDSETIAAAIAAIRAGQVLKVNGIGPDSSGDVILVKVPYADNLSSEDTKEEDGSFIRRTAAGSASISDGSAWLNLMRGNSVHTGYVEEVLNLNVIPVTRPTPAGITAEIDEATFEAAVEDAGTYTTTYDGSDWSTTPAEWGVTVSGTPLEGDSIVIVWDGENNAEMTVNCPRTPEAAISAEIDRSTFIAYVAGSGTYNLYFTTEWSADPEDYGITVTGTPLAGDQLQVEYVEEERGTITQATPTALVCTGWNLYEAANGYAQVLKYSETHGYKIGGSYSALSFRTDPAGSGVAITPDENGLFSVPGDGYVVVTGGSTDTYIYLTWSDWTAGYEGDYESYAESTVDLSTIMAQCFPYGLMKVGTVMDEIDRQSGTATSWVQRMAYSAANRAAAEASGLQYDFDENYIYIERDDPVVTSIDLTGEYDVCDHGIEYVAGTSVPVYCEIIYGENLRDKLRRDVLTMRAQELTAAQKAQARANIGAGTAAGEAALQEGIAIVATGDTHAAITSGQYVYVKEHASLAEGLYKATTAIAANAALTTSNLTAVSGGLGSELASLSSKLESKAITITAGSLPVNTAKRSGNVCVIGINYWGDAVSADSVAFTIGEGDRPISNIHGVLTGVDDTDGKTAAIEINSQTGVATLKVGIAYHKRFQGEIVYIGL